MSPTLAPNWKAFGARKPFSHPYQESEMESTSGIAQELLGLGKHIWGLSAFEILRRIQGPVQSLSAAGPRPLPGACQNIRGPQTPGRTRPRPLRLQLCPSCLAEGRLPFTSPCFFHLRNRVGGMFWGCNISGPGSLPLPPRPPRINLPCPDTLPGRSAPR